MAIPLYLGLLEWNCYNIILPDKVSLTSPSSTTENTTPTLTWNEDTYSTWYKLLVWDSSPKKVYSQWHDASEVCLDGNMR